MISLKKQKINNNEAEENDTRQHQAAEMSKSYSSIWICCVSLKTQINNHRRKKFALFIVHHSFFCSWLVAPLRLTEIFKKVLWLIICSNWIESNFAVKKFDVQIKHFFLLFFKVLLRREAESISNSSNSNKLHIGGIV